MFGDSLDEAFYLSWLATEQQINGKMCLSSLPDEQKHKFIEEAQLLINDGWHIFTTIGTYEYFKAQGIRSTKS